MDDYSAGDYTPPTQPSGSLVPPPKIPGTALATLPAPLPGRPNRARVPFRRTGVFFQFIQRALDTVDDLADTVAGGLGLRRR